MFKPIPLSSRVNITMISHKLHENSARMRDSYTSPFAAMGFLHYFASAVPCLRPLAISSFALVYALMVQTAAARYDLKSIHSLSLSLFCPLLLLAPHQSTSACFLIMNSPAPSASSFPFDCVNEIYYSDGTPFSSLSSYIPQSSSNTDYNQSVTDNTQGYASTHALRSIGTTNESLSTSSDYNSPSTVAIAASTSRATFSSPSDDSGLREKSFDNSMFRFLATSYSNIAQ